MEATDGGDEPRVARANVVITVGTEGNDRPVFRNAPYEAHVREDEAPGSLVSRVVAHDPDGDDAAVRCERGDIGWAGLLLQY